MDRSILQLRPAGGFQLVVADPPWPFVFRSDKGTRKAPPYKTMSIPAIQAMQIEALLAPNALGLVWVTAPALPAGIVTLERWGLRYVSFVGWRKRLAKGGAAIGLGYRVRSMMELCLLGVRGKPRHRPLVGCFDGVRREHSRKPEEFYDMLGLQCPTLFRRADLWARQTRDGWVGYGDELHKFVSRETQRGASLPIVVADDLDAANDAAWWGRAA